MTGSSKCFPLLSPARHVTATLTLTPVKVTPGNIIVQPIRTDMLAKITFDPVGKDVLFEVPLQREALTRSFLLAQAKTKPSSSLKNVEQNIDGFEKDVSEM